MGGVDTIGQSAMHPDLGQPDWTGADNPIPRRRSLPRLAAAPGAMGRPGWSGTGVGAVWEPGDSAALEDEVLLIPTPRLVGHLAVARLSDECEHLLWGRIKAGQKGIVDLEK